MTSPIQDSIHVVGTLRIAVRDVASNQIVKSICIKNMITYKALAALVKILSQKTGDPATNHNVNQLHVGTGNTPPVKTDTALVAQVYSLPTLIDANKVLTITNPFEFKILATLPAGTGGDPYNGVTLTEAGLFTTDGDLFARQIHSGILKTTALSFDYDWRIAFTA